MLKACLCRRSKIYLAVVIISSAIFIAVTGKTNVHKTYVDKAHIIGCAPPGSFNVEAGADGKFITILPGWGNHAYTISTTNDSAQLYFNQGLTFYYSYHPRQALGFI